jgi:hypothetical protein
MCISSRQMRSQLSSWHTLEVVVCPGNEAQHMEKQDEDTSMVFLQQSNTTSMCSPMPG